MTKPDMAQRNEAIRRSASVLERDYALILRTARAGSQRDGLTAGSGSSGLQPDSDVHLTVVEAAAIAHDPREPEVDQAKAIILFQAAAAELMERAAEFSHRLFDRAPKELRDAAAVTCVGHGCENLRGEGWPADRPNGKSGYCRPCYRKREKLRAHG